MAKRVVTMTIDEEVYLHYRVVQRINISNIVNDFLKNMMNVKTENLDEQKIMLEIEEAKQQQDDILQKQMILSSQLSNLKAKREEAYKKEMKRIDFVTKTTRNSGAIQDIMRDL